MHTKTEVGPIGLRKRIIEDVLCVFIMAAVAAAMVMGTPSRKTVAVPHGTTSAPLADHGPTAGVSIATVAEPIEKRSFQ